MMTEMQKLAGVIVSTQRQFISCLPCGFPRFFCCLSFASNSLNTPIGYIENKARNGGFEPVF